MSKPDLDGFVAVPASPQGRRNRRSEPRLSVSPTNQISLTRGAVELFDEPYRNVEMYFNKDARMVLLHPVEEASETTYTMYINSKNRGGTIPRASEFFAKIGEMKSGGRTFHPTKFGENMIVINLDAPVPQAD